MSAGFFWNQRNTGGHWTAGVDNVADAVNNSATGSKIESKF